MENKTMSNGASGNQIPFPDEVHGQTRPATEYQFGPRIKIHQDQVFYENDHVFAFVNLRPYVPGHVLVSPKRLVPCFKDLQSEEVFEIFKTGQMIGKAFMGHFRSENFHYTVQDGEHAGQTVPHVHLHILPGKDQAIGDAEVNGAARTLETMKEEALVFRKLIENQNIKL